ncbi:MAG TPA: molybdenum cofactor guanylyltransferase [Candidatus Angelobacter sp.]|nr:molybdenum cofactor guanylyltransferase [Candidatus Angelobacter sp.]
MITEVSAFSVVDDFFGTVHDVYDQPVNGVTGFVLAGGKSSRMGSDKAFLQLGGETLLSRALRTAGAVTQEVKIVGGAEKFASFGLVIEDLYRDRGPLGGIHAALVASDTDLNLMLAVDLPFVESKFLEYMISQAQESAATVTIPRAGGGLQPLCAVYRRGFVEVAEPSLRESRNKIDALFEQVETRLIEEDELTGAGFSPEMFKNLNTPEELKKATRSSLGRL